MKYKAKVFGIIALAVIIAFSFTTCGDNNDFDGNHNNNSGGNNSGSGNHNNDSGVTIPNTPTDVTATSTSTSITVNWSFVSGANGYNIYRSSSSSGAFTQVGNTTSTSWTNTGLSANTTYWYRITAFNSSGASSQSNSVSATTQASSGGGGGASTITWTVVPNSTTNTTGLNFTFSAAPTGLTVQDITITPGTGSATRGTLSGSGTTRSLSVSNVNSGTISVSINRTGIDSGPRTVNITAGFGSTALPGTPMSVNATALTQTRIQITWVASTAGGTPSNFHILRSNSASGTYTQVGSVAGNITTFTNTNLTPSTRYFYRVRAENIAGTSSQSITFDDATTLAPVPLTGSVTINGSAQVGQTLTANASTNLSDRGNLSYQWRRGTTNISGATSSTYTVQSTDAGSTLTVVVTRPIYTTGQLTSSPTATVTTPLSFSIQNSSTQNIEIQIWLEGHREFGVLMPIMIWTSVAPNSTVTWNNRPAGSYRVQARTVSPQGSWHYHPSITGFTSLTGGNASYRFTGTAMQRL
jgi:hypothetical protein